MKLKFTMFVGAGLLVLGQLLPAQSEDSLAQTSPDSRPKTRAALGITPEREAAALLFVQRNHPELADLLTSLKSTQRDEYERAVRDIFRNTERLAVIQERDSLLYDLEVAAWRAQSRVQLLAARLTMGASDELKSQLREALNLQNDAKLALLKHERQKAADRIERIEKDIARFETDREQVINKQLSLLTQAAEKGRPAVLGPKNTAKLTPKAGKQGKKNPPTK